MHSRTAIGRPFPGKSNSPPTHLPRNASVTSGNVFTYFHLGHYPISVVGLNGLQYKSGEYIISGQSFSHCVVTVRQIMAELNVFTENLKNELTCSICDEIFKGPRTLQCLHTFCFHCIKNWNETCQKRNEKMTCPTCRAEVNVEGGDVSKLPASFTLNSLLQLFNAMKTKVESKQNKPKLPECAGCSKRVELVAFCPRCGGIICNECINAHNTLKALSDHRATRLTEFNQENLNSYINNKVLCKEKFHEKNRLEYHCQTCRKCICQKCAATAHSTHNKVSIEEAAEDARKLLRKDKNRLTELLDKYKKEKQLSNNNKTRIVDEVNTAKKKIRDDTKAQMKILQDQEDKLIAALDDFLTAQTTGNDNEKNDIEAGIKQVTELKHQCQTMEEKNFEHFILEGYESLLEICNTALKKTSILSSKPVKRNSTIKYIPNQEGKVSLGRIVESVTDPSRSLLESLSNATLGCDNHFKIVTRNSEGTICYTNEGSIDVQMYDTDGNNVQTELSEIETGRYDVKYKVDKLLSHKIIVTVAGKDVCYSPQIVNTINPQQTWTQYCTLV